MAMAIALFFFLSLFFLYFLLADYSRAGCFRGGDVHCGPQIRNLLTTISSTASTQKKSRGLGFYQLKQVNTSLATGMYFLVTDRHRTAGPGCILPSVLSQFRDGFFPFPESNHTLEAVLNHGIDLWHQLSPATVPNLLANGIGLPAVLAGDFDIQSHLLAALQRSFYTPPIEVELHFSRDIFQTGPGGSIDTVVLAFRNVMCAMGAKCPGPAIFFDSERTMACSPRNLSSWQFHECLFKLANATAQPNKVRWLQWPSANKQPNFPRTFKSHAGENFQSFTVGRLQSISMRSLGCLSGTPNSCTLIVNDVAEPRHLWLAGKLHPTIERVVYSPAPPHMSKVLVHPPVQLPELIHIGSDDADTIPHLLDGLSSPYEISFPFVRRTPAARASLKSALRRIAIRGLPALLVLTLPVLESSKYQPPLDSEETTIAQSLHHVDSILFRVHEIDHARSVMLWVAQLPALHWLAFVIMRRVPEAGEQASIDKFRSEISAMLPTVTIIVRWP
ncbi:hypothetical protein FB451DRAFT_1471939 [Mycena latifolia]|nr:hypothetical protein FB451DRAFT_1471939 [Mycena latifolia]